jgi:hypothetical protein
LVKEKKLVKLYVICYMNNCAGGDAEEETGRGADPLQPKRQELGEDQSGAAREGGALPDLRETGYRPAQCKLKLGPIREKAEHCQTLEKLAIDQLNVI